MWHMGDWGWGAGWMIVGWIWMVVFWGALIWLIVWGVKRLTEPRQPATGGQTPVEVLKLRYARGEVTRQQYEEMKRDLTT